MEDFKEVNRLLEQLFDRWQDEWQYEDLNDYLEVIKKVEPRAYEMTDEPYFGVKIRISKNEIIQIIIKKD